MSAHLADKHDIKPNDLARNLALPNQEEEL